MEDNIVEWSVEHTFLEEEEGEEEEEEEDDYEWKGKESKIRWIVDKGLWLGKKVMITGIVMSSAPVVLPPLIVISALGFASSVPFGLAFAGYTCTEKLMNKLLPRSEPPLLLEYGEMYGDEDEYDEQVGGKGPGPGGEMWMEEEEKKEMEDVKEGIEKRIQLVMDESVGGYEGRPTLVEDTDFGRAVEEREINIDEGGKEEGYEEDVGEYLEGETEGPVKEMNLETEREREADNLEFDEKIKTTEGLDLVATEARGESEGEKDVTLTPGLPERNLVEVYVENSGGLEGNEVGKDARPEVVEQPLESNEEKVFSLVREIQGTKTEKGLEGNEVGKDTRPEVVEKPLESNDEKVDSLVREIQGTKIEKGLQGNEEGKDARPEVVEKPLRSNDEKVDSLVREIQGTKTEKGLEVTSEEKEVIEVTKKPNVSRSSKKHHKKKKANDRKNVAISEEGEGFSNKQQEDIDVKLIEKKEEVRDELEVKQDEKNLPVKRETSEGKDEANQSGASKEAMKAAEVHRTLPGSRDTRNGKDVGQAVNSTKDPKVISNGKHVAKDASRPLEGNDNLVVAKEVQRKAPDVQGNLPSERKGTTDQKKNANASGVTQVPGRAGIAEAKHAKEFFSEEKIWEKINAMRTIVGYTAAPQPLMVDELKALYIFTGVEPPSMFSNASNLAEVDDKLQFLMSIVGIK